MASKTRIIFKTTVIILLILIIFSILVSAYLGTVSISFKEFLNIISHKILNRDLDEGIKSSNIHIIWELRVPRVLLALAIGGGLAISGAAMQSITQNVLAEPYILGVSSGALFGVTFAHFINHPIISSPYGVSIAAFLGAFITIMAVYKIGLKGKRANTNRLILTGMALSIILNAFSNYFIIMNPRENAIRGIVSWTMGSLAKARWNNLAIPFILIILFSSAFIYKARDFDTIALGRETALGLGVDVEKIIRQSIIFISAIAGVSVAAGGIIGLVGFVIPHIIRMLGQPSHNKLFPYSFLGGALILIWMDILSRIVMPPHEMPIGIFTALFGGPFFVALLIRDRN